MSKVRQRKANGGSNKQSNWLTDRSQLINQSVCCCGMSFSKNLLPLGNRAKLVFTEITNECLLLVMTHLLFDSFVFEFSENLPRTVTLAVKLFKQSVVP